MITPLIVIAYIVIGVCLIPWMARGCMKFLFLADEKPEIFDYVFAVFMSAFIAPVWPVAVAIFGVAKAMQREDEAPKTDERVEWP